MFWYFFLSVLLKSSLNLGKVKTSVSSCDVLCVSISWAVIIRIYDEIFDEVFLSDSERDGSDTIRSKLVPGVQFAILLLYTKFKV